MHRLSLCLLVSLLSACIVHAAPPTVGQYEIRKRTSTGFDSYGVTLTNGQAIGQSGGIPAAVTVGGGSGTGTVTSVALTLPGIFSVTGSPITESGTLAASLATQTANQVWAGPNTGSAAAPTFRALVANDLPDLSSVYQPIAGILTAFSGLSNATGVLTNNGSGSLSYTATSTGGNKDADSGKLVKFDSVGGVYFSNEVRIYPYPSGSNFLQFNNSRIQWLRGVSDYCNIIPSEAGSACTFYFPTNPGTHTLALEDGNITGTAGGLSSTLAVTSGGTGQTSYTDGQLLIGNTTGNTLAKATLTAGSGISITNGHGTITIASTSSGGTVTSVALTLPGIFSVTGSPITESGTLAASLATQTANRVWAGPTTGTAAAPTFRALVAADIPDLSGTYQPRASTVTAFGELANAAGVLTNNGSGTLSYTATSTGGNGTDDSGKIAKFNPLGQIAGGFVGSLEAGPSYNFVSIDEGLRIGSETNSGTFGIPTSGGAGLVWTLPGVTGTFITTGNLSAITATGTVTSGTWNGTAVAAGYGGTGQTTLQASINALMAASGALSRGDIFYYNGTNVVRLAAGTSGNYLKTQGSGADPLWAAVPSGLTIGSTAISGGTDGYILYYNAGILGNLATTGSGSVVRATSPTLSDATINGKTYVGGSNNYIWRNGSGDTEIATATNSVILATFTGSPIMTATISGLTLPGLVVDNGGAYAYPGSYPSLPNYDNFARGRSYRPGTGVTAFAHQIIAPGDIYDGAGITITDAATLYIHGEPFAHPAGGAIAGNKWALWIGHGDSRFDGSVALGSGGTKHTKIKSGVATLVAGTVTVSDSDVLETGTASTSSRILVTRMTDGGTLGTGYSITRTNATSFTITSSSSAETSTLSWVIFNP